MKSEHIFAFEAISDGIHVRIKLVEAPSNITRWELLLKTPFVLF